MNNKLRHTLALLGAAGLTVLTATAREPAPWETGGSDYAFSVGYRMRNVEVREMHQERGLKPKYDRYRMASVRHMLHASCRVKETYGVHLLLGMADLSTHSREGETTDFDPEPALGIGADAVLYRSPAEGFSVLASTEYLVYSPQDESTEATARNAVNSGGDVDIDWREFEFGLTGRLHHERYVFSFGLRYMDIAAEQDRAFPHRTVSSRFEQDEYVGAVIGVECDITETVQCSFRATFIDDAAYEFGIGYSF